MNKEELKRRIKIEQAYVDGKDIQRKPDYHNGWLDVASPEFNWFENDYRIKPEPLECWINVYKYNYGVFETEEKALNATNRHSATRIAVHMREVIE